MRREQLKHFADKIEDVKLHEYVLDKYDFDQWSEVINYISGLRKVQKDKKMVYLKKFNKISKKIRIRIKYKSLSYNFQNILREMAKICRCIHLVYVFN